MEIRDNPLVSISFRFQDGVALQWAPGAPIPQLEVMTALGTMAGKSNLPVDIQLEPGAAVELIAAERTRQVEEEGWTEDNDDAHVEAELGWAAVCYASPELVYKKDQRANAVMFKDPWPWEERWDSRPHDGNVVLSNRDLPAEDRVRQLTKAGALIAAEIDRLQRKAKAD